MAIDLFFWFDKSTKRKASLKDYCNFCDITYRNIIKHVNTRWLSLEQAVNRVLQQYDALKSYFLSGGNLAMIICQETLFFFTDDCSPRFQRLKVAFGNQMTEIYLLFYQSALQIFVNFNKFLQREDPLVSVLSEQVESFLTKLASKFVPVAKIKAINNNFLNLQYKEKENQLQGMLFLYWWLEY